MQNRPDICNALRKLSDFAEVNRSLWVPENKFSTPANILRAVNNWHAKYSKFQYPAGLLSEMFRGPCQILDILGYWSPIQFYPCNGLRLWCFNATFINISVNIWGQFYWWRKLEYQKKTTDLLQLSPHSSKLGFRIYWLKNFKIRIFIQILLKRFGKSHWFESIFTGRGPPDHC